MIFLPCLLLTGALGVQESPKAARVLAFEARPCIVKAGEPVELSWASAGAETVWLDPPGEALPAKGKVVRTPEGSTVYWLFAGNGTGGHSVPVTVDVRGTSRILPKGIWIQFAALADAGRARRLQEDLRQCLGDPVRLFPVVRPGLTLQRVRLGPFSSWEAARRRLREIRSEVLVLRLKPWVTAE